MRNLFLILLALTLAAGLAADPLSCYDIQYTTNSNGSSIYDGQVVTVQAIVTAVNPGNHFYIGDAAGGAWSGLYVFHGNTSNSVMVGDDVILTGTISEYGSNTDPSRRLTELTSITSYSIVSQSNVLPPATSLTTAQIGYNNPASEPWEGVLVRLTDVQVRSSVDSYGQFRIADSSNGEAMVDDGLFNYDQTINNGDWWYMIQGMVDFHYVAGFKVNPRNSADMVKSDDLSNASVRIETSTAAINELVTVPILTSRIKLDWGISSWKAKIKIDSDKVNFHGLDFTDAMSDASLIDTLYVSADGDTITIEYESLMDPVFSSEDGRRLISLILEPKTYGEIILQLLEFSYDNTSVQNLTSGKLRVKIEEKIAWLNISNSKNSKNIFNPALNEKITIEYGVKSSSTGINARAYVRIYDVQGRLVATPVNKLISNALGIESYQWDGRDTNMKVLPVGMYYCHFEVVERSTGKKETTVQPIVIKSIMK